MERRKKEILPPPSLSSSASYCLFTSFLVRLAGGGKWTDEEPGSGGLGTEGSGTEGSGTEGSDSKARVGEMMILLGGEGWRCTRRSQGGVLTLLRGLLHQSRYVT